MCSIAPAPYERNRKRLCGARGACNQGGDGASHEISDCASETSEVELGHRSTDLDLAQLWIVHPGRHAFLLDERITAMPLHRLAELKPARR